MSMQDGKEKKKKEKITYIDDGRTIADMSGVSGSGMEWTKQGTTSSPKEIWDTYWSAVKMMFKPMLVVVGFLCTIFGIAALLFWII